MSPSWKGTRQLRLVDGDAFDNVRTLAWPSPRAACARPAGGVGGSVFRAVLVERLERSAAAFDPRQRL